MPLTITSYRAHPTLRVGLYCQMWCNEQLYYMKGILQDAFALRTFCGPAKIFGRKSHHIHKEWLIGYDHTTRRECGVVLACCLLCLDHQLAILNRSLAAYL